MVRSTHGATLVFFALLSLTPAGRLICAPNPQLPSAGELPVATAGQSASPDQQDQLSRKVKDVKTSIVEATGIGKSSLHILFGGLVFGLCALAFTRFNQNAAVLAAAVTLGIASVIEFFDWRDAVLTGKRLTLGHALKDIFLTCAIALAWLALPPLYKRIRGRNP